MFSDEMIKNKKYCPWIGKQISEKNECFAYFPGSAAYYSTLCSEFDATEYPSSSCVFLLRHDHDR